MPCSGGRSIMRLRGVSVSQVLVPKTILMQTGSCLKHKIKFCTHFYMVLKIKRLNEQCSLCKIWYGVHVSLLDRHTLCVCVCVYNSSNTLFTCVVKCFVTINFKHNLANSNGVQAGLFKKNFFKWCNANVLTYQFRKGPVVCCFLDEQVTRPIADKS